MEYIFEGKLEDNAVRYGGELHIGSENDPKLHVCEAQLRSFKNVVKVFETDDTIGTVAYLADLYHQYTARQCELYEVTFAFILLPSHDIIACIINSQKKSYTFMKAWIPNFSTILDFSKSNHSTMM